MSAAPIRIGVIGGSGLYRMADLTNIEERRVETPFGPPSDALTIGTIGGERVAFLPRHGVGHRHGPSDVPYRANIWAMQSLGVQHLIAVSAVGSSIGGDDQFNLKEVSGSIVATSASGVLRVPYLLVPRAQSNVGLTAGGTSRLSFAGMLHHPSVAPRVWLAEAFS